MERTVILGCGDAGLIATAYLARDTETDVVVISEREYHVFSFLLYRVIAGRTFDSACLDLRRTFRGTDVTFVQGLVETLDLAENRIHLRSGSLHFDTLLITVGGVTKYTIDDRRHVLDIRTDARDIRSAVASPDVRDVVIVGGGPVGVETGATLSTALEDVDVTLVTSDRRPLSDFPPRASELVERELRRRGIDLRVNTRVSDVTENRVVLGGDRVVRTDLTVWAGGVQPNPVIEPFDLPQNERGLRVDPYLRCDGTSDVYAAGDVIEYPGKAKDGYSAGLEARTAAKNVRRGIRGRRLKEHDVRWHPRVVSLGRNTALFTMNGVVHRGRCPALLRAVAVRGYPFYWKYLY
ncbi:NAD(P)/FAD-dependent oxidoreductase [Halosolutus halophilus]|uniref:NAD(P)/FAD-dependent oxidoreductase n=1 Tax=Halosolutus halophilus TaxID=1552990 RepID=UPI0022351873|nr:FAD-dependent oxidoreductase [Halosolutus halophilus]